MPNRHLAAVAAAVLAAAPVFAESHASGDAAAGEKAFRKCQACHVVANDAGDVLAGRSGKTGPNLYMFNEHTPGTVDGFKYSDAMVEAGEAGLTWSEETFAAYVADPTAFLREFLDDGSARSKMTFKVRKEQEALDLYAYITGLK